MTGVGNGLATISYSVGSCTVTQPFAYTVSTPDPISGNGSVCPPLPVTLLSESFENSVPPSGWGYQGTTAIWFQTDAYSTYYPPIGAAEDGNYVAEADFYDYTGASLMWSSPFSMVNIVNGQVSLWVYRDGSGAFPYASYSTEGFNIVLNTTNAIAGGTVLGFIPRAADGPTTGSLSGNSTPYSSGWYQYTATIPASYTGSTNYLLIRAISAFGNSFYLDNVVISGYQLQTTTLTNAVAGGSWSSNNTAVATIDASGNVTGLSTGTSTISYTNGCGSVTKTMTVLGLVSGVATAVCPASTIILSDPITGGAWTSSNTSIASVNASSGIITGVSAGTSLIDYSLDPGCILTTSITVNPSPATIAGNPSLCMSLGASFSDASGGGTWISSDPTIFTIDLSGGGVTTVAIGTATVTYTLPTGCIATQSATVNPIPVPITSTGGSCITDPVNPTVTLTDVSSPGLGTWSVSDNTLASIVSFSGEVTGLAPGALTVSYTLPTGCYATTPYLISPCL